MPVLLSAYFGTSDGYSMSLQSHYDDLRRVVPDAETCVWIRQRKSQRVTARVCAHEVDLGER
jgi:hypothetical protein